MRTVLLLLSVSLAAAGLAGTACSSGGAGAPATMPTATASPAPTVTGNAGLDLLIADLEAQDVEALLRRVEFQPVPCEAAGIDYQPPPCPPGVADGTPLPAFLSAACEGQFLTSVDQLRAAFQAAFETTERSSLFAIGRGSLVKHGDLYNVAVVVPGQKPDPLGLATLWYTTDEGKIVRLQFECDPLGAAQTVEALGLGGAGFVVGPQSICQGGERDITIDVVRTFDAGGARPEIIGTRDGHREIVLVLNETILPFRPTRDPAPRAPEWSGGMTGIEDVKSGMRLRINGWRMDNCVVEAWSIAPAAP